MLFIAVFPLQSALQCTFALLTLLHRFLAHYAEVDFQFTYLVGDDFLQHLFTHNILLICRFSLHHFGYTRQLITHLLAVAYFTIHPNSIAVFLSFKLTLNLNIALILCYSLFTALLIQHYPFLHIGSTHPTLKPLILCSEYSHFLFVSPQFMTLCSFS
jgi:hypothetical protein